MQAVLYKKISHEMLNELIERAQGGDIAARNLVIVQVTRLVMRLAMQAAKRYRRTDLYEDLVQCAIVGAGVDSPGGVLRAIERFDPSRNRRFTTFATPWIKAEIQYVLTSDLVTRRSTAARQAQIRRACRRTQAKLGRAPTASEVSAELAEGGSKFSAEAVQRVMDHSGALLSYNPTADTSAAAAPTSSESQILREVERAACVDENDIAEALDRDALLQAQAEAFVDLDERERLVLRERYGLGAHNDEKRLVDVGKMIGLSRERVRLIEIAALGKIRDALAPRFDGVPSGPPAHQKRRRTLAAADRRR
jgi:RNA polymerase sigma factor (sigma-70 family)